jgi:ribosome biogenesis GTPase
VLPRRHALVRNDVDRSSGSQVIAANVDVVLIAVPQTEAVRVRKLERYVAFARSSGAEPLVVLTKADVSADLDAALADAQVAAGDAAVLAVDSLSGTGLDELEARLHKGSTVVVVGPSGAGKSTLANALGAEREQATGAIRDDGKGRHTTTARELVRLAGGALLIDTPGLRSLELFDAEEAIETTYGDVTRLAQQCRFRDCRHGTEPGCAVNAAVYEGHLTGDRIDAYAKLRREEERLMAKVDGRVRAERNKRLRAFHRSLRDQPSR